VLELSDQTNEKGYHPPRAIHPERCVVCRLCELICPEFCIFTVEAGSRDEPEEGDDG
jgi:2-oxoglutarate ferredoxin oxidoreductase subunit delta